MHTFNEHDGDEQTLFGRPVDDFLGDSMPVFTECDVEDKDLEYQIELYLPGFRKRELRLIIKDDLMVLMAFRFHKEKGRFFTSTYREIVFKRSFVCPIDIAANTIRSRYLNGILSITLPKQLVSHSSKHPFYRKDRIVRIKGEKFSLIRVFRGFKFR